MALDPRIPQLLSVIEHLEIRLNGYWNFFGIAVIATAGWMFTAAPSFSFLNGIILMVVLAAFLFGNLLAIMAGNRRSTALEREVMAIAKTSDFESPELKKELSRSFIPGRGFLLALLHIIIDVGLLIVVWTKVV